MISYIRPPPSCWPSSWCTAQFVSCWIETAIKQWLSIRQGSHHMSQQVSFISVCYCRCCVAHLWVHEYISLQQEYCVSVVYCQVVHCGNFGSSLYVRVSYFDFLYLAGGISEIPPKAELQIWRKYVFSPNGSSWEFWTSWLHQPAVFSGAHLLSKGAWSKQCHKCEHYHLRCYTWQGASSEVLNVQAANVSQFQTF